MGGNGVTGSACAQVCKEGCEANTHCLAYYYGDQQSHYGTNAIGQCIWQFDTPENCKAASALNPYNSGGHPVYGNWATMTNHFCGNANGCGWNGGKACRSGPWTPADDAECVQSPAPGYSMYKKVGAPTPAPPAQAYEFVGNCFTGSRTGQQMFADGYTYGGGGGTCGNGVTGSACAQVCKE